MAVDTDDRRAVFPADMPDVLVGIGAVGGMAVDAMARHLVVLEDCSLLEIGETALVYSHAAVDLVAGRDAPIGDAPSVDLIGTDKDLEVAVLCPLAVFLRTYGEGERSSLVRRQQRVPLVDVEIGTTAVGVQATALGALTVTSMVSKASSAIAKSMGAMLAGIVTSV